MQSLNRREFLAGLGAASAWTLSSSALARPARPLHVIIIGAGMAGLCAAYELEQRGHRTTILEADSHHVGGRVRTVHFGRGLYGELGAMRIPASHTLSLHYIHRFGLPLRHFVEFNTNAFYYVGGVCRRIRDAGSLDPRYAVQGIGSGPGSLWTGEFHELIGGMDRLTHAFLSLLGTHPRIGCPVFRVEQRGARATVFFHERGHVRSIEGDRVLCTAPASVLNRIGFHPAIPTGQWQILRAIRYYAACKTLSLCRHRFWEQTDGIFGGASYTDLPIGSIYYPSDNARFRKSRVSTGPGVLVASYALDQEALRIGGGTVHNQTARAIQEASLVHPHLRERRMLEQTVSWNWETYPWSRGAFAAHGQDPALIRRAGTPHGMVHFAGEHLSSAPSWIQGALESALEAVRAMLVL